MADVYFGNTRPNKTKAEELIVEVEMEAAVDDEINTLLFEFVEVYGLGAAEVDERVVSLFSRPDFQVPFCMINESFNLSIGMRLFMFRTGVVKKHGM